MSPYRRKEARREDPGLPGPEALEQGVVEALPGLVVLDRRLELGSGAVLDLAAVDAEGGLVLVAAVEADDDAAAVLVLDALAFARRNAVLFPRHFDASTLRTDLPARVCVVAPAPCPRLAARLAPLVGTRVELFELRSLRSSGGDQTYLVRSAQPAAEEPERPAGPERFLAALPREARATAEDLVGRMERMDPDLVLSGEEDRLSWSLDDELVARLDADRGRLRGAVPPRLAAHEVDEPEDVERFLGEAMGRFAELLGTGAEPPERPPAAGRPGPPRGPGDAPDLGPGEPMDQILTPAEIQAFREL